jgi:lysophospholipase L1-like esterase
MRFRIPGSLLLATGLSVAALALAGATARAQDKKDEKRENTAVKPSMKDEKRHLGFLEIVKKGKIDVVFLGDSITDGWGGEGHNPKANGAAVWKEHFEPLHAVNLGIGGDRTQHVLWRVENGEFDGYTPKAVVLMIGTNNLGSNTDEEIADGIKAVVEAIHKKHPKTKVLLLGIFPRGEKPTDKNRDRIKDINKTISKLDDKGKTVRYLDIGDKFVEKDGTLSKDIMYDFLHLTPKGYQIEADAIEKPLKDLMK